MSKACLKRIKMEAKKFVKDPPEGVKAVHCPDDLQTWHYVIEGPKDSPYEGGYYHGVLLFPDDYPYKPPGIMMYTPSGRFKVRKKLCLSNSDFHPESWSPLWTVSSILAGFTSFMVAETRTYGSINQSDEVRRRFARKSLGFNVKNRKFSELFPDLVELYNKRKLENPEQYESDDEDDIRTGEEVPWFLPAPTTIAIFGVTCALFLAIYFS